MPAKELRAYLDDCMKRHDSSGGVVECIVSHFPAGAGTPVFEKLDACLGKAVLSIGAVKEWRSGMVLPPQRQPVFPATTGSAAMRTDIFIN